MTTISLALVPGIPVLARGLATGEPDVRAFLPDRPDLATIRARATEVRAAFVPRASTGTSPALASLARGERAAVLTGQQAGLFGGPLLTLVKALALEKLAAELEGAGAPAGAAFWCASEDHDLVEVTRLVLPTQEGPKDFGPEAGPLAGNQRPVGRLPLGVDTEALVAAASASLARPPDEEAVAALTSAHRETTFFGAFSATLAWLLGGEGLNTMPVVDAASAADKPALVPLASRLVRERAEVKRVLAGRGAALEAAGHRLQVTTDPAALPLFARVGEDRLLLVDTGSKLALRGRDGSFEAEEVVARFASGDWLPSFSALTRPLAASTLFPVAATILGPAEIAYWAQSWPLFAWAGIVPPVIVPRPLVALLSPAARRGLEKLGLSVEDVLEGPEAMLRKKGAGKARELLGRLRVVGASAERDLLSLKPALLGVDTSLGKAVEATREKTAFAFEKLVEKTADAAGRADEVMAAQVTRLAEEILPRGSLAERVYSALPYTLRFGRGALVGTLRRELKWNETGLQVLEL
ncbi:MAG: bacillithiol biosynthesis BshC [Thermoanaerobaculia bacterium]|nr:bacillithiol biosynthesis BshC [Thermoanaerobaculia bacterium]